MAPTSAGYSGTPLAKKLGIKEGFRIALWNPPDNYADLLGPLPAEAGEVDAGESGVEFSHVFAKTRRELEAGLDAARAGMVETGMIWLSWPKKSSGVETELDGNIVRETGLEVGLVDIKVCAVDEIWSGLKFVIRVVDRA